MEKVKIGIFIFLALFFLIVFYWVEYIVLKKFFCEFLPWLLSIKIVKEFLLVQPLTAIVFIWLKSEKKGKR